MTRTSDTHRRRWAITLLAVLGLVAAACGDDATDASGDADTTTSTAAPDDDDDGADADADEDAETDQDADTDTTSSEPVALTATWTGVTEDTIRLGFTTSDLIRLREMNLVDIDRGDPQMVLDALVDDVNERGGINGRMLEAHLEVLIPFDATEGDAACVRLTEDVGVFAVLAPFVGPNADLNTCFNARNETIVVGGQPTTEQLAESTAPWISPTMFSDRRLTSTIALMDDADLLGDRVGVAVTVEEQAVADEIVVPELEARGKEVFVAVQNVDPVDALAGEAAWERFIELWRTEDVDSVLMVENTATFGSAQLARSDLDANYLIADTTALLRGLGAFEGIEGSQLAGIIGSAGPSEQEAWELDATQDCIDVFETAHPEIEVVPTTEVAEGESDWYGNINVFCPPLRLFELVATAAGPDLTHESFVAAAEGLGEIELPGQVFASLGPGKYDAADAIRLTVFDETVGANGGEAPYGPLERVG